jgi:hypothetical protein
MVKRDEAPLVVEPGSDEPALTSAMATTLNRIFTRLLAEEAKAEKDKAA